MRSEKLDIKSLFTLYLSVVVTNIPHFHSAIENVQIFYPCLALAKTVFRLLLATTPMGKLNQTVVYPIG